MYNELFTRVKRWLTNRIHGKAAEHSVTATKYIEYSTRYPFCHGACWHV